MRKHERNRTPFADAMALCLLTAVSVLPRARGALAPAEAYADEYSYNPTNKIDPFLPISLRKPNIRGVSRLQDYEIAELELVGTVLGSEITALILTPGPREGILAKIGDRVGRKGGRIIAIARDKVVVREQMQGLMVPGHAQKFNDVTMVLTRREQQLKRSDDNGAAAKESDKFGFPNLGAGQQGAQGSPAQPPAAGISPPAQFSQPPPSASNPVPFNAQGGQFVPPR